MRRALPLALLAFVALAALAASPARANGILVTSGDVVLPPDTFPPDRVGRRPWPGRMPVRLRAHRVTARIDDRVSDVTVEQVFRNDSPSQLEGTYLFPLPDGATVGKFAMTMAGKMVEGEVVKAEDARRIYEDIVRRRRDPGLLEYVGRGLFKARVFPIEPHSDLTIRLQYQQVLREDAGTLEMRYPLATDRLNGAPVEEVLVDVTVTSPVAIRALYSPSHDVGIARDGDRKARVTYERTGLRQEKDFLLYVGRSADDVGFSLLSSKPAGEDGTFLAVFAPKTDVAGDQAMPKDVVFVLDTSGSMLEGGKMEQARRALTFGVRTLRRGDRFNAIAFSTGVEGFREGLVDFTDETRDAAVRWIEGLQAHGGTNIEAALAEALRTAGSGDRLSMVVFVTDGKPSVGERNPDALVRQVEAAAKGRTRVFTFGVGFDLDVALLDRIAEATRGARDYVTPQEDLEVATSRFFRKVQQPVMTDVRVDFGGGVVDVYPQRLSDLFAGGQVTVMGRFREPGARTVRLTGRVGSREVTHEYAVTFQATESAAYLPRLWAHRKIAFLLDAIRLHGENRELVDEVVRLATRHGIVTPYTAGLVVEDGELDASRPRLAEERAREVVRRLAVGGRAAGAPPAPVPPGLRAPAAGESAPATPGPTPVEAPKPEAAAKASDDLAKRKDGFGFESEEDEKKDAYLEAARDRVQAVEGKTFLLRADGRWVDTSWDGKGETTKIEAFSEAWFALSKDAKAAKWLAVGERVVFVLGEGETKKVYEIVPAPAK